MCAYLATNSTQPYFIGIALYLILSDIYAVLLILVFAPIHMTF